MFRWFIIASLCLPALVHTESLPDRPYPKCGDVVSNCPAMKVHCTLKYMQFMKKVCAKTCGICRVCPEVSCPMDCSIEFYTDDNDCDVCRCKERHCNQACPKELKPVCGSDGKTYNNLCLLWYASCMSETVDNKLFLHHDGECKKVTKCNRACTTEYNPMCGSDGKTYSNPCVLESASCMNPDDNIVLRHAGECKKACVEGDTWKQDCNDCRCVNGIAMCTRNMCPTKNEVCPDDFTLVGREQLQCITVGDEKVPWMKAKESCSEIVKEGWKFQLLEASDPIEVKNWITKVQSEVEILRRRDQITPFSHEEIYEDFWLGASRKNKGTPFNWENGKEVDASFPWGVNDVGVQQPGPSKVNHCLTLKYFEKMKFQYANNNCQNKKYYMCEAVLQGKGCAVGSTWKEDCNSCTCVNGLPACTKMACLSEIKACVEGSSWKDNCNDCTCRDGVGICTLKDCKATAPGDAVGGDTADPQPQSRLLCWIFSGGKYFCDHKG